GRVRAMIERPRVPLEALRIDRNRDGLETGRYPVAHAPSLSVSCDCSPACPGHSVFSAMGTARDAGSDLLVVLAHLRLRRKAFVDLGEHAAHVGFGRRA